MALQNHLTDLAARIGAEVKTVRSTDMGGLRFVKLTQSAYDLLSPKDANTVYLIVG